MGFQLHAQHRDTIYVFETQMAHDTLVVFDTVYHHDTLHLDVLNPGASQTEIRTNADTILKGQEDYELDFNEKQKDRKSVV